MKRSVIKRLIEGIGILLISVPKAIAKRCCEAQIALKIPLKFTLADVSYECAQGTIRVYAFAASGRRCPKP